MTTPLHYPLGALVSLESREAWISAFSRTNPPLYRLSFIDGLLPQSIDWVPHSSLTLLDKYPMSDERLSTGLRTYLNQKRLTDV